MGDTKKPKKKYSTSRHPWIAKEIAEFKILREEFGLKNRREILKASSFLRKYKDIAKKLIAASTVQAEKEKKDMQQKLHKLALIPIDGSIDNILSLQVRDVLNRRLETVVLKKGLARSIEQSRQFITHRHIIVDNKEITSPSFLVSSEQEAKITFKINSALRSEDHPERVNKAAQEIKAEAEAVRNYVKKKEPSEAEKA